MLLINWSLAVQTRGDWHVIVAPISLRYKTAEREAALQLLLGALAAFYDDIKRYPGLDTNNATTVRAEIENHLRHEPPPGKRLLVILDGLDEIQGEEVDDTLFPGSLAKGIRIIASARQIAGRTYTQWPERLGWKQQRTMRIELPLLGRATRGLSCLRAGEARSPRARPAQASE